MHKRFLISSILVIVVSAVVAQAALSAGEAKNELPFTRQVTAVPNDTSDVVSRYLARQQALADMQGEAKNELPFTRQVTIVPIDRSDVVSRYLARRHVSGSSSHNGLDWTLVAIGIAAAVVAVAAGAALRLRRIPRHKVPRTA